MRNVLAGLVCLLLAGSLSAGSSVNQCSQPNLLVSGIQGEMAAPCTGALDFTSASFTAPSSNSNQYGGGGGGAGTPGTLKVARYFDKASPGLMSACAQGKHIQQVRLSYPSGNTPVSITFQDVVIASVNESVNPTNESVEFKAAKVTVDAGGGTKFTSSVMGNAHAGSLSVAAVNGDGHSQPVSHLSLTVRPGSTTFNQVQLAPPPAAVAASTHAGMAKTSAPTIGGAGGSAPTESVSINYGKIHFEYHNQGTDFQFSGGQVVNGNLRVSKASYTGSTIVAVPPR